MTKDEAFQQLLKSIDYLDDETVHGIARHRRTFDYAYDLGQQDLLGQQQLFEARLAERVDSLVDVFWETSDK